MKTMTIAAALALSLGSAGAMAENSTLVTLENDSAVVQLTDLDLAAVQGGFFNFSSCAFCANTAYVAQNNFSFASLGVLQSNYSEVYQSNN